MENPIIELSQLKLSKLLLEKKLEQKDLPSEIDKKIKMLKANVSRYNNGKRTTQFYETLMAGDDTITDAILDFLQLPKQVKTTVAKPIDTPPPTPIDTPPVPPVPPIDTPPVKSKEDLEKEEQDRIAKEKQDKLDAEENAKKEKVTAIDNAIKEKMQQYASKDVISIADLQVIAGSNISLGTEIVVGTTKLRKVYKQSFYRLR